MRGPLIPKIPDAQSRVYDVTLRLNAAERDALVSVSARVGAKTLQETLRKLIMAAAGQERAA